MPKTYSFGPTFVGATLAQPAPAKPSDPLWICGRELGDGAWEFCGVFSTEALAVRACGTPSHFAAPAPLLDAPVALDIDCWPGLRYPKAEAARALRTGGLQ